MRTFNGVADAEAAIGEHLGHSPWHEIEQPHVDLFADATHDHQWIHVDPERAARGPFGGTIAHGFLTLALIPKLVEEVYRLDGVQMLINYGADRLRFPAPVPVGSRVRAGVQLTSITPATLGHLIATRVTVDLEGATKPACVVDSLSMVVP